MSELRKGLRAIQSHKNIDGEAVQDYDKAQQTFLSVRNRTLKILQTKKDKD